MKRVLDMERAFRKKVGTSVTGLLVAGLGLLVLPQPWGYVGLSMWVPLAIYVMGRLWEAHQADLRELGLWLHLGGDLFITYHAEGDRRILSVGPGWLRVLGWRPEEMIGERLAFFIHPQDTHPEGSEAFVSRWLHKTLHEGKRWVWLEWRVVEGGGPARLIFAYAWDRTVRSEHAEILSTWANISSDLMIVANTAVPIPDRKPEWVNSAWEHSLGWSVEELYEKKIVDLLAPEEAPQVIGERERHETRAHSEPRSIISKVLCKPENPEASPIYKTFRWTSQVHSGRLYVTGRDISAEINHQAEIQEIIHNLQIRNQDLERFASVAAHQLRAPPRTIAGLATVLQEDYAHLLDKEALQCLADILQETDQMGEIIDGLYRFSKVRTSDDFKITAIDLDSVLRTVEVNITRKLCLHCPHPRQCPAYKEPDCPLWGYTLIVPEMPSVLGDKTLLQEVFTNLIDNGFKFNESREKVVCVTWEALPNGRISFRISDNGIGIPKKYQEKLFTMFQRMHPTYAGTGVGLALVAAIIQKLGGVITVESDPDRGSTFIFDLASAEVSGSKTPPPSVFKLPPA